MGRLFAVKEYVFQLLLLWLMVVVVVVVSAANLHSRD